MSPDWLGIVAALAINALFFIAGVVSMKITEYKNEREERKQ